MSEFKPKLFTVLKKKYGMEQFTRDVIAGIIVAIIALPLSIALAIASGVTPEKGLHTAIIGGFIISFLGGSRVQIGGPTGAFMVIVYGIIARYGVDGLIISTIMAGIFLILLGLCRLGSVIKFIPYPITTGFTSGIAVTIFTAQLKDFFGLEIENVPAEFAEKWVSYAEHFNTLNIESVLLGVFSLAIIIFWPKVSKKIPGSLIALIAATLAAYLLKLDVATIGSKYGELSSAFPKPRIPSVDFNTIKNLIPPAVTIALLGGIESLLSAVVADGMIGSKHRSNMELVAQGTANIASGVFGGIPATGAIARTVANIKNGGRSPVAGMTHAIVLLLIMLLFMPLAKMVPLTALAAILMAVAYNMSEWRTFKGLLKAPKSDIFVLLTTFFLTVFIDLVVAIEVGIVLACILFMKRMSDVTYIKDLKLDSAEDDEGDSGEEIFPAKGYDNIMIYEVNGPLFFGAADKFMSALEEVHDRTKIIILRLRAVPAMDATAFRSLEMFFKKTRKRGRRLFITEIQQQPYSVLEKADFFTNFNMHYVCDSLEEALQKSSELLLKESEKSA